MTTLTLGRNTVRYASLCVRVVSATGAPVVADSVPLAAFYRVDPDTGLVVLDVNVGSSGIIATTAVPGTVGVYSVAVPVSALTFPQYHVHFAWTVSSASRSDVQGVLFLRELDMVSANYPVPETASRFSATAPGVIP